MMMTTKRWILSALVLVGALLIGSLPVMGQGDNAPQVLRVQPSDDLKINQPVRFFFTEPMNRESVESAFDVEPDVPGEFTWTGDNKIMTFRPSTNFDRQSDYAFTLGTEAQSEAGVPLAEPYALKLSTGIFATNPGYMAMGYVVALAILAGMVGWIYMRYQGQQREIARVEALDAESRVDGVHSAVGAVESDGSAAR
jgi:hypothetical protein